jgi:hypothetical protein
MNNPLRLGGGVQDWGKTKVTVKIVGKRRTVLVRCQNPDFWISLLQKSSLADFKESSSADMSSPGIIFGEHE